MEARSGGYGVEGGENGSVMCTVVAIMEEERERKKEDYEYF